MTIEELATTASDFDLTGLVTVFESPALQGDHRVAVSLQVGTNQKPLSASDEFELELVVEVDSIAIQPSPVTLRVLSGATRVVVESRPFTARVGSEIVVKLLSTNQSDTDVGVVTYLYDVGSEPAIAEVQQAVMVLSDLIIDQVVARLVSALEDTNELQADWAEGGRLAVLLDSASDGGGATGGVTDANIIEVNGNPVALEDLEFYISSFSPVKDKVLEIVRGNAYKVSIGNSVSFTDTGLMDLSSLGATDCKLTIKNRTTGTLAVDHQDSVSVDDESKTIKFELTTAQTTLDSGDKYQYDVEAHFGSDVVTLFRGICDITSDVEASS